MKTVNEHIRERLLRDVPCGQVNVPKDMAMLLCTQWSDEFERLRKNRMIMGRFRYGNLKGQKAGEFDNVESMIRRLREYQKTGNQENLVDVANICMVEFVSKGHPDAHFTATDDGIHTDGMS